MMQHGCAIAAVMMEAELKRVNCQRLCIKLQGESPDTDQGQ